jgi:hypothetical protein
MPDKRRGFTPRAAFIFILGSVGLAVWGETWLQSASFTIQTHRWTFRPLPFLLAWALSLLLLWGTGMILRKILKCPMRELYPLFFLGLAPFLCARFLTRSDLKVRLALLAGFVILAAAGLVFSRWRLAGLRKEGLLSLEARFEAWPEKKRIGLLFLTAWLVYGAFGFLLVSQDIAFYGDEPHYLMISHSLLKDGDIDLANNFAARDYFHFYEERKDPHLRLNPHGQRGKTDPRAIYPINMPGISILILPFYGLSFLAKGNLLTWILKCSLAFWAALLGVQFYLLALRFWNRRRLALGLWALYAFTAPVLFFSIHLYPEIPIAFLALLIFRKTYAPERLSAGRAILFGLLMALFPWFGLKYLFLLGPLLVVAVVSAWTWQKSRRNAIIFLALPLAGMALYFLFIHHLYGTWSPASVYKGAMSAERAAELSQDYLNIPLSMRLDTLAGYFLDQRDGLLPYAPFYFFALLGLIGMLRRRARDLGVLLFVSLPYVGVLAFLTERGGFSPPARPLTAVSWILMLGVGAFIAENRRPAWAFAWKAAVVLSLAMAAFMALHPFFLYQPTTHDTPVRAADAFVSLGHLGFFPPSFLPSFIKYPNGDRAANFAWLAVLALAAFAYFVPRPKKAIVPSSLVRPVVIILGLGAAAWLWVLFPRPVLYGQRTVRFDGGQALSFALFPAGRGVVLQNPGKFFLHYEKTYRLFFQSARPLRRLDIDFGSRDGDYDVRIDLFDLPLHEGRIDRTTKTLTLPAPESVSNGGLPLYELVVSLRHRSGENMLDRPFLLSVHPPSR